MILVILAISIGLYLHRRKKDYTESPIEKRMLTALLARGYKVKPQVWVGKYRVDLLLTQYRVIIECDGKAYHSTAAQKKRDQLRDQYLRRRGYTVLHVTGSQINGNISHCLNQIIKITDRLAG